MSYSHVSHAILTVQRTQIFTKYLQAVEVDLPINLPVKRSVKIKLEINRLTHKKSGVLTMNQDVSAPVKHFENDYLYSAGNSSFLSISFLKK